MGAALAPAWYGRFLETVQTHEASAPLRDAAMQGQLGKWTESLTSLNMPDVRWHGLACGSQRARFRDSASAEV